MGPTRQNGPGSGDGAAGTARDEERSLRRRGSGGLGFLIALLLATFSITPATRAEDRLFYEVRDGAVVITNTPSRSTRPLPGRSDGLERSRAGVVLPPTRFDTIIDWAARKAGISPRLVKTVTWAESGFNPLAVSAKGACGLMQLMPATAAAYGATELFDPAENLRAGSLHLRHLLDQFEGDLTLALAAYNAGAGAVRRSGGVPNYPETRKYVAKVRGRLSPGTARPAATVARQAESARAVATVEALRVRRGSDGSYVISN